MLLYKKYTTYKHYLYDLRRISRVHNILSLGVTHLHYFLQRVFSTPCTQNRYFYKVRLSSSKIASRFIV